MHPRSIRGGSCAGKQCVGSGRRARPRSLTLPRRIAAQLAFSSTWIAHALFNPITWVRSAARRLRLGVFRLRRQVSRHFVDVRNPGCAERMPLRELAARNVDRRRSAQRRVAVLDELARVLWRAKPEVPVVENAVEPPTGSGRALNVAVVSLGIGPIAKRSAVAVGTICSSACATFRAVL